MTDLILFDNFIITDNEKALLDWTAHTYGLKKTLLDKDSVSYGIDLTYLYRSLSLSWDKWNKNQTASTKYSKYCDCDLTILLLILQEGVFMRLLRYTNAHPWLWAVYLVVIGLPLVLIITFCCGSSQVQIVTLMNTVARYSDFNSNYKNSCMLTGQTERSPEQKDWWICWWWNRGWHGFVCECFFSI